MQVNTPVHPPRNRLPNPFVSRLPLTPEALDPLLAALQPKVAGVVETAHCPHGGGPPRCWCRPPLPGLPLAFAHSHAADPERSILIGTTPTHRTLATSLGARYISAASAA